jgi:predicted Fe-Mo cluster-binding NifX family protein
VKEQDRSEPIRIAIPEWNGRVSPVFDAAEHIRVLDFVRRREVARHCVDLARYNPDLRAAQLAQLGVNVLVCGAISHSLHRGMNAFGIRVIDGLCGETDAVLRALLSNGRIPAPLRLPGSATGARRSCPRLSVAATREPSAPPSTTKGPQRSTKGRLP